MYLVIATTHYSTPIRGVSHVTTGTVATARTERAAARIAARLASVGGATAYTVQRAA